MAHQSLSNYQSYPVRAAAILTNGSVAGTVLGGATDINLETKDTLILLVDFTLGSLTNAIIVVEFSPNGTTWYQEVVDAVNTTTGAITEHLATRVLTASGRYRLIFPEVMDKNIRISVTGTGTVTASSMTITALVGNA